MKRQFMKSLMALCTGVMTLVAASSLFVSCYDDSALRKDLEGLENELNILDGKLGAIESLQQQLAELTARVDKLYTLTFGVTEGNELQYSFDGKTWVKTGIVLTSGECGCEPTPPCDHECPPCQYVPCDHECPEVSVVDNGETITVKVGDAEFTITKPQEIVFEIRSGKVYFQSEGTATVSLKTAGIEDLTVISAPKGWWAGFNADGLVEITAPEYSKTQGDYGWDEYDNYYVIPAECAASGYVKVHACTAEGKCMVGKIAVEVVRQALSVKAYAGNAYFTVATTYSWGPTYFYGVSTKESLEADTAELIKGLTNGDLGVYDSYANTDEVEMTVSLEELLGAEPELGTEYLVWALLEDYSKVSYSAEDLVLAYYSPLQVKVAEVEAEKTAFNVTVDIEVVGAESYVALGLPVMYCDDPDYTKEMMAMAITEGTYYGKLHTAPYSGSALGVAYGTTYSMEGNYSPASEVFVFVLPLDGRPVEDYTPADVVMATFKTSELAAGGAVTLEAKQVYTYWDEVWDNTVFDYVYKEVELDRYSQVGVEVSISDPKNYVAFYHTFMSAAEYVDYAGYDEDIVDYLLENTYSMTPSDISAWPYYAVTKAAPNTTYHYVAVAVDKDGKYGNVAHVEVSTEELVKADFAWLEPLATNVENGVLKNTTTLEFTPAFEGGVEPASYKYVLNQTMYYNQYEGMNDAEMAEELYFSTSAKTVTKEELVNGVLYLSGHSYGNPYYFAIVPIDEEGKPGASAYILEYECAQVLDKVITEGAEFEATAPAVNLYFPADDSYYPEGGWAFVPYYAWEYHEYYGEYYYTYEINYDVTPVEGTEVCIVLADLDAYTLGATPEVKAGQVWSKGLGAFSTFTTTEFLETDLKLFGHYSTEPAPNVMLCVSWKDAEGNVYYKETPLQDRFQYYADKMNAELFPNTDEPVETALSVEGKQWAFMWSMMGIDVRMDVGVSIENYCMIGYDMSLVYDDPEAAGMWMAYMEGYYEVEATDATSGKIWLMGADYVTGELSRNMYIAYSDLTETTCTLNCEEFGIVDVVATLATPTVQMMSQMIGGW